jgi:hypothetical protein
VKLDHLIDCQVENAVHASCLLRKPFKVTSSTTNHLAGGVTRVFITRVPMRTDDDGVVFDAHSDLGIRFDVDPLENRPIEDQASRVAAGDDVCEYGVPGFERLPRSARYECLM